ncbi:MAG: hypothetical protein RMJ98_08750 [Myxococcales bacterium]|nr:hypothetical protein [Polyangiaceae bacterium]MDW8249377.1 hypothetical protein [Myxococcales bacterium]
MVPFVRLWFEGGWLHIEGAGEHLGLSLRNPHARCYLAPPSDYASLRAAAIREGVSLDDEVAPLLTASSRFLPMPPPDPRLLDLLASVDLHGGSGYLALPEGKPRIAIASLLASSARTPVLLLCPEDRDTSRWRMALSSAGASPEVVSLEQAAVGVHSWGHRFGLVLVDRVEKASGELLRRVLRGLVAPQRIGLIAPGSPIPEEPRALGLVHLCGELQRTHIKGRYLDWIRLFLPLDAREQGEWDSLACSSAGPKEEGNDWQRSWSLVVSARRKRTLLRELILRYQGQHMGVLVSMPSGVPLPSWTDLLQDLTVGERGPFLSAIRRGRLWLGAIEDLPTERCRMDVIVLLGGTGSHPVQVLSSILSRRGILYDLRAARTHEDPCWRWSAWHVRDDDEQEQADDP